MQCAASYPPTAWSPPASSLCCSDRWANKVVPRVQGSSCRKDREHRSTGAQALGWPAGAVALQLPLCAPGWRGPWDSGKGRALVTGTEASQHPVDHVQGTVSLKEPATCAGASGCQTQTWAGSLVAGSWMCGLPLVWTVCWPPSTPRQQRHCLVPSCPLQPWPSKWQERRGFGPWPHSAAALTGVRHATCLGLVPHLRDGSDTNTGLPTHLRVLWGPREATNMKYFETGNLAFHKLTHLWIPCPSWCLAGLKWSWFWPLGFHRFFFFLLTLKLKLSLPPTPKTCGFMFLLCCL